MIRWRRVALWIIDQLSNGLWWMHQRLEPGSANGAPPPPFPHTEPPKE